MACCKACCGCKECDEGEEGKCCCGQECCAADTYCCNAECVPACSEGQEGDCKCTDACCYQDEYCCDGECVEACGEGDAGPCKCESACCEEGEYCCDGECEPEPCFEPGPCSCAERGEGHTLSYTDELGLEYCCPPGTTLAGDGLCDCEDNDPRCIPGTPWVMSPESTEGYRDCGDFCVLFFESCPP